MNSQAQGSTSLNMLPSNPQSTQMPQASFMNSSPTNNIVLTTNDVVSQSNTQMPSGPNYNELITQLQQASATGATSLPSRDIQMNPNVVNNDNQTKPNYIAEQERMEDYIQNMQTPEHLVQQNQVIKERYDSLDALYGEFQLPILIAILYFLFQLPVFRRSVKSVLPMLFGSDGNPTLFGFLFNSVLFATAFYFIVKTVNQMATI